MSDRELLGWRILCDDQPSEFNAPNTGAKFCRIYRTRRRDPRNYLFASKEAAEEVVDGIRFGDGNDYSVVPVYRDGHDV
ncbi:hypothetical protein [Xanthomonas phage XPP1]|uniref:Uncharacterized protein n=1 Tax=Xanthomonas phage XPP1 TaxID=2099853 RepID=A0A3S7HCR9_9CAUD|nr:hypothetical protein KEM11_gp08 [Xanthomonas phage XPP1]AVO23777.1 hypothetical protein [Xanthomonas phage XPP2]AVO23855.1 hypothetical protein [Xanthomonas phage XPP3]AVO23872.1 hypothetical protein [Xanthomonas phage XPP4]AVO23981.1 hypothetical protein [Xanthomonas phage XPP6]AVO24040.1 hypothetical protein [Xanthomonas phage XPP8]AVO24090.1 hypothetical protein [Xanthomonas phage XPP9]